MKLIVDTNVPVTANNSHTHVSPKCVINCARKLREIQQQHTLVLDNRWHILKEYQRQLHPDGQPGVGHAFLKWVLSNLANPDRCEMVNITLKENREDDNDFVEFPDDSSLSGFDPSDRKFVAVAHPQNPPIQNATDTDWVHFHEILTQHGIQIDYLCMDIF